MYKMEIHLHSKACSACAVSSSVEMVQAAKDHGYHGVVFTNHFYHGNTCVDRSLKWRDFADAYRQDYLTAKAYGDQIGVVVLFGIEEGYEPGKEILIYGLEPELIMDTPEFRDMNVYEMSEFVRSHGGYVVAAHPFRKRFYIPDPDTAPDPAFMDAAETFNLFNEPERDVMAVEYAELHHLPGTSGGDIHRADTFGHSGLDFDEPVMNNQELVAALKAGRYTRIEERLS